MPLHLPARVVVPALAVLLAAGCAEQPTQPHDLAPSLGKGGVDTDSRARWAWADEVLVGDGSVAAGIRGDGLLADGTAAATGSSEYQGDVCGVHAKIFFNNESLSTSGDAVFDPDMNYSARACGGVRRTLIVQLPQGPVALAPFINARNIMAAPLGTSTLRLNVGLAVSGCEAARFHDFYDGGSGVATYESSGADLIAREVLVTREADDPSTGARRWRVESRPPHTAVCAVTIKGRMTNTSNTIYLPFAVEITEIPFGS